MYMKSKRLVLLIAMIFILAVAAFGCTNGATTDVDGNEVVIKFEDISEVSVLDAETLESQGFLIDDFKLSLITVHITYLTEGSVDIPLTENMIKAESKTSLTAAGVHKIYCCYGGKFNFEFTLRLYRTETNLYEVTFYDETGERVVGTKVLEEGSVVAPPAMPTKEGYTLVGWSDKATGNIVTDFTVRSNVAYVAVYEPDFYDVNFYYTVGEVSTLISTASVPRGGNALDYAPAIPVVSGYSNGRWSDENAMASVHEGNTDFYAVYDADKVLVYFSYYKYVEGEYYDESISWNVNLETEGVTPPGDAERLNNNVFLYWYVERDGVEVKVSFPYKVTGEMRFTAKYVSYAAGSTSLDYELNSAGTAYTVVGLKSGATEDTVVIPKTYLGIPVTSVKAGAFSYSGVKRFAVAADNSYFRAYDGVLYNAALTELIAYPTDAERTSFEFEERTVRVGAYAFRGAKYLTEVTLTQNVTTIGEGAFSECASLVSLSVPENVTVIEKGLVENSAELVSLTIGNAVTEIKDKAFYGAASLAEIALPSTLQTLGEQVFAGCKELTQITIKQTTASRSNFSVESGALYGYGAGGTNPKYYLYAYPAKFSRGNNASEYTVHADVRVVKSGALSFAAITGVNCTAQRGILFEDYSVVSSTLVSMRFAAGNVTLSQNTFGDKKPSVMYLSEGTTLNDDLGINTVVGTPDNSYRDFINGFAYEINDERQAVITAYKGTSSTVNVPGTLSAYTVVGIKNNVFAGMSSIREVVLPDSLREIGDGAFRGCKNLVKVTFGKNLVKIGEYAFADCGENVNFDGGEASVVEVGTEAFGNYDKKQADENGLVCVAGVLLSYTGYDKKVTVPSDVTVIAQGAFKDAPYVSEIDFSAASSLVAILAEAFDGCEELISVEFPENLEYIGERAFYGCVRLKSIIGKPAETDTTAFDCTGTEENECFVSDGNVLIKYNGNAATVVIPDGIKEIGNGAFVSNGAIRYAVMGSDVTTIGKSAFENCRELLAFTPTVSLEKIDGAAFYGCEKLATLNLETAPKLESIAYDAFEGTAWLRLHTDDSIIVNDIYYRYNGTLEELHIPNSVKTINERAFYGSAAPLTLYIPESVTSIGKEAFAESGIGIFNFGLGNVSVTEIGESAFENCYRLSFLDVRSLAKLKTIGARAFAGVKSEESGVLHLFIPATVTEIGEAAFENSGICTVRVEDGSRLERINEKVFAGCYALQSVIFEGSSRLNEIAASAFENCEELKIFNNTDCVLERIGDRAFAGAVKLENFKISEERLIEVGKDAFENNKFVADNDDTMVFAGTVLIKYNGTLNTTVVIPSKTTAIANSAFAGNSYIRQIIFGTNGNSALREIQDEAFAGCGSLTTLNIPDSVEKIGKNAFSGCVSLTDVDFGKGLTEIGFGAFSGCSEITQITLPSSLSTFGGGVFAGCENLVEIYISGAESFCSDEGILYEYSVVRTENGEQIRTATLLGYPNGFYAVNGKYAVPETVRVNGTVYNVTGIGDYAFADCPEKTIKEITLHDKIEKIGAGAFAGIKADVVFAENATIAEIGEYAFAQYLGKEINIPSSVTAIGQRAFEGAKELTVLTVPSSVTEIASYAFSDTSMAIVWENGGSVGELADYAFVGYLGEEITVPTSVVKIGRNAFEGVTSRIEIAARLTAIDEYAFYGYAGTSAPVIPEGTETIGDYAFASMTKATEDLIIPESAINIGRYAFDKVAARIVFASGSNMTTIGEYAFAGYAGATFAVPQSVTEIAEYAFYGCDNLETVDYGTDTDVEIIGRYAFAESAIKDLVVPDSVKEIGERAFASCEKLESVTFGENSSMEKMGEGVFASCGSIKQAALPFVGADKGIAINSHIGYVFGARNYADNKDFVPQSLETVKVLYGSIEANAFYGCDGILSVEEGNGVDHVEEGAFIGCDSITELTVSYGGVFGMLFGADAYRNNGSYVPRSLEKVTITKITELSDYAFYYCMNVREINLPDTLTVIGDNAFFNCSRLETAKIGENVVSIGNNAFARCSSLVKISVDENNARYTDDDGVLYEKDDETVTAKLLSYPQKRSGTEYEISLVIGRKEYEVTEIGGYAFYYSELSETEIPETVVSIGEYAFAYSSVNSVRIRTDAIGRHAFTGSRIRTVYVEHSSPIVLANDDYGIFTNAYTVHVSQALADSVRETTYIYKNFTLLTTTATNRVMTVDKYGVRYVVYYKPSTAGGRNPVDLTIRMTSPDCGRLTIDGDEISGESRYIAGTVISLGAIPNDGYVFVGWFANDTLVSSNENIEYTVEDRNVALSARFVYIGEGSGTEWSVLEIGDASANGDRSVVYYLVAARDDIDLSDYTVLIFDGTGAVGYTAESHETHKNIVTSIKIGEGVTSLPNGAFEEFIQVRNVSLSSTLKVIGERAFYGCSRLTQIVVPEGVDVIGASAFENCLNLARVTIEEGAEEIGSRAFAGTVISEITLPASVASIETDAFIGCGALKNIYVAKRNVRFAGKDGALFTFDEETGEAALYIFPSGRDGIYTMSDKVSALCGEYTVTAIGSYAFAGCDALEGIVISSSVKDIERNAFEGSGITVVETDGNEVFAAVGGVLYKYGETEQAAEAEVIYNYSGEEVPSFVVINGKQYTVVNP